MKNRIPLIKKVLKNKRDIQKLKKARKEEEEQQKRIEDHGGVRHFKSDLVVLSIEISETVKHYHILSPELCIISLANNIIKLTMNIIRQSIIRICNVI